MAKETISQILSPTNATYVNGVSAERRFAEATLKAMFQKLVEKDGKGVNDSWVKEDAATHAAQVFVNRIIPVAMESREMGANKNGASYSANQHYTATETVAIELLQVLDDPILIPRARRDMIPTDLVATHMELTSARFATILNGATAGSKLLASYLAGDDRNHTEITSSDVTNKQVALRFMEANSKLDEGDMEHGIDIFPEESRIAVIKVGYRPTLLGAGVLTLGGANYAYDILAKGGLNQGATPTKREDGFIGTIDGVDVHVLSNESLAHASQFMGLPKEELRASDFIGYIASSYANARGVSSSDRLKVVDEINGQGVRILPYFKFGVATWYQKGVVTLGKSDYNPIAQIKALFPSANPVFKLKSAGSRLVVGGTAVWTKATTGFTLAGVSVADDNGVDHKLGYLYVVADKQIKTLDEFYKGYTAVGAVAGSVTIGSAVTCTIADGDYINVLALADDGTISFISSQYTA